MTEQFTKTVAHGDTIALTDNIQARVTIVADDYQSAPWQEQDGVLDIKCAKAAVWSEKAGDTVIHSESGSVWYYNLPKAIEKAKKEGWGLPKDEAEGLAKRQITVRAVEHNAKWCAGFLRGAWHYVAIGLVLETTEGEELAFDNMGGFEDTDGEGIAETLNGFLAGFRRDLPRHRAGYVAELEARINSVMS